MTVIPLLRTVLFGSIFVFSFVVLGSTSHLLHTFWHYINTSLAFIPLGLGAACLTIISSAVIAMVDYYRRGAVTSMILFQVIWSSLLWMLWAGTAGDMAAVRAYYFPRGCIYHRYPTVNQLCYQITISAVFAFATFFCAFVFFDVIFLYAVINAVRGRGVWTASVKEAASGTPITVGPGVSTIQAQFHPEPGAQFQTYGVPYPLSAYPRPNSLQQQTIPQGPSTVHPGMSLPYDYPTSHTFSQRQVNYATHPAGPREVSFTSVPPNYSSRSTGDTHSQLPSPSGSQGQFILHKSPSQAVYGLHQPVPV